MSWNHFPLTQSDSEAPVILQRGLDQENGCSPGIIPLRRTDSFYPIGWKRTRPINMCSKRKLVPMEHHTSKALFGSNLKERFNNFTKNGHTATGKSATTGTLLSNTVQKKMDVKMDHGASTFNWSKKSKSLLKKTSMNGKKRLLKSSKENQIKEQFTGTGKHWETQEKPASANISASNLAPSSWEENQPTCFMLWRSSSRRGISLRSWSLISQELERTMSRTKDWKPSKTVFSFLQNMNQDR